MSRLKFTKTSDVHIQIWRKDEQIASLEITPGNCNFVITPFQTIKLSLEEFSEIYEEFKQLSKLVNKLKSFDSIKGSM